MCLKYLKTTNQNESRYEVDWNELKYNVDFLHLVRHTQIHLFDSLHLYGCGQAHQGLPKVILNVKSAICYD